MLQKLESVLILDDGSKQPLIQEIIEFYGSDFDSADRLTTQLRILTSSSGIERLNLQSIIMYIKTLTHEQKEYFSEVIKILKLILLIPATNATSERSFSALRRLKTWLRTTMSQQRVNWCMILHEHKDRTDKLSITDIADEFIGRNQKLLPISLWNFQFQLECCRNLRYCLRNATQCFCLQNCTELLKIFNDQNYACTASQELDNYVT